MENTPNNLTVLVVDDEPGMLKVMSAIMAQLSYQVVEAVNAQSAFDILARQKIDLVITDVMMPGISGIDLLKMIRQNDPEIPIIIQTGEPRFKAAIEAMKLGANDYLPKPVDILILKEKIENLLNTKPTPTGSRINGDDPALLCSNGRVLGGYTIIREIAEGTHGVVFLAENENSGQFALKILKTSIIANEDIREYLERFIIEAEVASKIRHPNIVRIVEYGVAEEELIPYIVMDYIAGKTLREYMESPQQIVADTAEKIRIIRQIATALEAIHTNDICHRDIKPENIILDSDGNVQLTDFGIAHLPDSELTGTRITLGTPRYLAPEAILSAKVHASSDIFSLGVVAYELLLDQYPFSGTNFQELLSDIAKFAPLEPRKIDENFPASLQGILALMLKKNPETRYQSVSLLLHDIDDYIDHQYRRLAARLDPHLEANDWV